jgi:poly-beta-1,6-N-acetyl-D-glucosamine synthase
MRTETKSLILPEAFKPSERKNSSQPSSFTEGGKQAAPTLASYVVVTPARNEARSIELTIRSMLAQTILPRKWVIVSDGSTDGTDDIVAQYAIQHPWIELVRLPERSERNFAGKVHAFNAGLERLASLAYDAVVSLDADITFDPEYFSFLLGKLSAHPDLGLVGTPFRELSGETYDYRFVSAEHVSGACQVFRRSCFEAIGGYVPIRGGSIDHVAVITARMKGWKTRTFTGKHCLHHRNVGTAQHGPVAAKFKLGVKDYAIGNHPLWEVVRCAYQITRRPRPLGGLALGAGYFWAFLRRDARPVSAELVAFHRGEQIARLRKFFGGGRARSHEGAAECIEKPSARFTMTLGSQNTVMSPTCHLVEVRSKGHWVKIPALYVNGDTLITKGKRLRIAKVRGEEMREKEIENPEIYLAALRSNQGRTLRADIFTFSQKLPVTQPKYSYPMELESVAAISLSKFSEWWEELPQETRKNVRRSQKRGVSIAVRELDSDVVEGIRSVNDDTSTRQGAKNAYYKLSAEDTWERYGEFNDRCDFICAYAAQEMIGFLHLVYRGNVAAILNLTVKPTQSDKRPANALVAKAVEICESRGISHISYGLYNYGNKRDSPLREFKIRNGFREILVPRYFVPVTIWGKLCIKANFHRGLIGILPPSLISFGLRARASWLARFHKPV